MALSRQYNDLNDLDKLDWSIIFDKYWHDIPPLITDRKRKRQAEFLVYNHIPLSCIIGIGVINKEAEHIVKKMITESGQLLSVHLKPNWYF